MKGGYIIIDIAGLVESQKIYLELLQTAGDCLEELLHCIPSYVKAQHHRRFIALQALQMLKMKVVTLFQGCGVNPLLHNLFYH